jgi:tetratricopeptide (TPR) repeat protein
VSTTRRSAPEAARRAPPAPGPAAAAGPAPAPFTPTADAIWRYANAALEACWLVVAAVVPLYIDLLHAQPGLSRGLLLQVVCAFMALLWLVQWAAGRRSAQARASRTDGPPGAGDGPPRPPIVGGEKLFVALAAAYAATTLLATLLSPLPEIGWWGSYLRGEGTVAALGYMVLFLVVADRLRSRAQLDRLVSVLLAASLAVCLYAVAQVTHLDSLNWQQGNVGRAISTAGNAIFLAAYLGLLLPLTAWRLLDQPEGRPEAPAGAWWGPLVVGAGILGLAMAFAAINTHPQGWWAVPMLLAAFALVVAVVPPLPSSARGLRLRRLLYGGLLLLQLLVIGLSASRGPLAALVIAVAAVAALSAWRARRQRQLAAVGGAVALVVLAVLAVALPGSPLAPLTEQVPLLRRVAAAGAGDTGSRVLVWQTAAEALVTPTSLAPNGDPLGALRVLVGFGPESVVYLINRVLPPPSELGRVLGEFWDRTHNAWLDRLLMTGVLGLIAYLALIGAVLLVALRRIWPTTAPFGWGLYFALAVTVLGHLVESQTSMLALPQEAIFWLLAGVAVAPPALDTAPAEAAPAPAPPEPAPAPRRGRRLGRAGPPALDGTGPAGARLWPAVVYAVLAVLATLVLLQLPAIEALLAATVLAVGAVVVAPLFGGLALAPAAPAGERGSATPRALGAVALAAALALLLGGHQLTAMAADAAFHQAELGQVAGNFPAAIRSAQGALALAPDQPEYYHVLGQYYGALAGPTTTAPRPDFAPSLAAALTLDPQERLGRDQLFAIGRASLDEAVRRNPLEARYWATLGELDRYWGEVAAVPEHLPAALASFERAAALKPNDVEVHSGIADARLLAGDAAGALAEARYAVTLLPFYWYPYDVEARAALAAGDPSTALEAAGNALMYVPYSSGLKAASTFERDRLRNVVADALASGQSAVQPGALVRDVYFGTTYRIDDGLQKHLIPAALLASCAYPTDRIAVLPEPVVSALASGPEAAGCEAP